MTCIKYFITILLTCNYALTQAQDGTLFQTGNKTPSYYVDLNNSVAVVFKMGGYFDVGGSGHDILMTDTLHKQSDNTYLSKAFKITKENDQFYLATGTKKTRKRRLEIVANLRVAYNSLNNAFYLNSYIRMTDELNKAYPLNHYSFRDGFDTWKTLEHKDVDYREFRDFTNSYLKTVKDSLTKLQDGYVARTNYLLHNLKIVSYQALQDSLAKLKVLNEPAGRYFSNVISEVAKQQPEYFFKLAEDDPHNRNNIFYTVGNDKDVIHGLKNVPGHAEIKKEFFNNRRYMKFIPFQVIGTYALVSVGLVIAI